LDCGGAEGTTSPQNNVTFFDPYFSRLSRREVQLTAWLPGWLVRTRVADILERRAMIEFEADYRGFYRPGESKDRLVGAPSSSDVSCRRRKKRQRGPLLWQTMKC
jgi:hypothetical protein